MNIDYRRYIILGACNPTLAHKALLAEEQIGLLLPCNVIVYEREEATVVAAFEPLTMLEVVENEKVGPIAEEVKQRLSRVMERV